MSAWMVIGDDAGDKGNQVRSLVIPSTCSTLNHPLPTAQGDIIRYTLIILSKTKNFKCTWVEEYLMPKKKITTGLSANLLSTIQTLINQNLDISQTYINFSKGLSTFINVYCCKGTNRPGLVDSSRWYHTKWNEMEFYPLIRAKKSHFILISGKSVTPSHSILFITGLLQCIRRTEQLLLWTNLIAAIRAN